VDAFVPGWLGDVVMDLALDYVISFSFIGFSGQFSSFAKMGVSLLEKRAAHCVSGM